MTIDELKSAQEKLGLNHNQMASCMGVKRAQFYNWRSGRAPIPHWVSDKIKVAMMEKESEQ